MTAGREIVLPLRSHPHGWLVLPVAVHASLTGTPWELELVLNTGRTQSVLSRSMLVAMRALGLFGAQAGPLFVLHRPTVDGALLPDLPLRESAGPGMLGVDGMLGLDFFGRFADACIGTSALRLTLVP